MVHYGLYWNDEQRSRRIKRGASTRGVRIPLSIFFSRKVKGTMVVIKTNFLRTRGTNRGKLLNPKKEFGKLKKHIDYIGREENIFYDKEGDTILKEKVWEEIKVKNPFIIHRMVLSPWKKLEDEQFKAFVKYEIAALRKMLDKKKNFDYFYTKHDGNYNISANVILYSNNQLFIKKHTLKYMKDAGNKFMKELEKGEILLEPEPDVDMEDVPLVRMILGKKKKASASQSDEKVGVFNLGIGETLKGKKVEVCCRCP